MKVVLLHAFPLDEGMWEPQLDALTDYETFAPRLYGLGSSIDEWAEAVLRQADGDLVAVGASMGGYCALAMARREPDRVRGLSLAGSRAGPDSPERRVARDEIIRALRERGVEGWYDEAGNPAPRDVVLAQSADDLINAMEVLRDRPDFTDVVGSFAGPFLLAVGDRDELLSVDEATRIVELAPKGRLAVFEGAGHVISLEQPERFNGVLLDFLADRDLGFR
jgi:pimeloyl-ACP methyl ester carboxylesterase